MKIKESQKKSTDHSKIAELTREIHEYSAHIKEMDDAAYKKIYSRFEINDLPKEAHRLQNIRDEIKLTYGKVKEEYIFTQVYKEDILWMLSAYANLPISLQTQGKKLQTEKRISKKQYWDFFTAFKTLFRKREKEIRGQNFWKKYLPLLKRWGIHLFQIWIRKKSMTSLK